MMVCPPSSSRRRSSNPHSFDASLFVDAGSCSSRRSSFPSSTSPKYTFQGDLTITFAVLPASPLHQSNFSKYDALLPLQANIDESKTTILFPPTICFPVPCQVFRSLYTMRTSSFNHLLASFHIPCIIQFISRRFLCHSPHKTPEPTTLLRFQPS